MVLNVPWTTSMWAKAVAKDLDLSLAELLSEILTAHTATVAADLAANPPVGKQAGSGPYDHFTFRADPVLRARLDETADQLGFASRSELVSRLLESARCVDGEAYGRRLDERTQLARAPSPRPGTAGPMSGASRAASGIFLVAAMAPSGPKRHATRAGVARCADPGGR